MPLNLLTPSRIAHTFLVVTTPDYRLERAKDLARLIIELAEEAEQVPPLDQISVANMDQEASETLRRFKEAEQRVIDFLNGQDFDAVMSEPIMTHVRRARDLKQSWAKIAAANPDRHTAQSLHRWHKEDDERGWKRILGHLGSMTSSEPEDDDELEGRKLNATPVDEAIENVDDDPRPLYIRMHEDGLWEKNE